MILRELVIVFVLHVRIAEFALSRQNRIVVQLGILEQKINRIQTKPGDAMLVPESSGVEHGLFHGRVAPVQVWLGGGKVVVVILTSCGIKLPGRTSKT